jgi:hypothetical protein
MEDDEIIQEGDMFTGNYPELRHKAVTAVGMEVSDALAYYPRAYEYRTTRPKPFKIVEGGYYKFSLDGSKMGPAHPIKTDNGEIVYWEVSGNYYNHDGTRKYYDSVLYGYLTGPWVEPQATINDCFGKVFLSDYPIGPSNTGIEMRLIHVDFNHQFPYIAEGGHRFKYATPIINKSRYPSPYKG